MAAMMSRTLAQAGDMMLPDMIAKQLPHNRRKRNQLLALKKARQEERKASMYELAARWIKEKNKDVLAGAIAFVPWIVQEAHSKGHLGHNVVIHKGVGAVVFSDASGFTALTEKLAKKSNGAELLSQCLTAFFTPLIKIISAYRGDVIKFSGDALTIYFPAVQDPDLDNNVPPCGTYGCSGHSPEELCVLRASACCIEIHRRLHMFDTGVDGVRLCLHIGVGFGDVTILQVGGLTPPETHAPRYEYVICGPPMEQISIAEPLASNGETCLSPEAWALVQHTFAGTPVERKVGEETKFDFIMLGELHSELHTFPVLKAAAIESDRRHEYQFETEQLDICRRYIPSAVFKQIAGGTLTYVNEMRNISVIFINVQGIDVSTAEGSLKADELMKAVQSCCTAHEGTLNKFLVDDKGMLFLLCFGLPPLVHTDDCIRAVLCCMDIRKHMKRMELIARFGVTTGRNYCGVVGSASRMEYTVLGDSVNLSARLMAGSKPQGILVGERTYDLGQTELDFNVLEKIKVKGKSNLIPIFEPMRKAPKKVLGKCPETGELYLPWTVQGRLVGGTNSLLDLSPNWRELIICQKLLKETNLPVPDPPASRGAKVADVDDIFEARAQVGLVTQEASTVKHHVTVGKQQTLAAASRQNFEDAAKQIEKHSVFERGGPMVLIGGFGLGKTELIEYVAHTAMKKFKLVPIVGSQGVRPGELGRVFSELLRSLLSAFRCNDPDLPRDSDLECLRCIIPAKFTTALEWIPSLLGRPWSDDDDPGEEKVSDKDRVERYKSLIELIIALLRDILKKQSVVIALRFERGTNLFTRTDDSTFWMVSSAFLDLYKELKRTQEFKTTLTIVLCIRDRKTIPGYENVVFSYMREVMQSGVWLDTHPFDEKLVGEYMATELNVPLANIPNPLIKYISDITLGNALFVREAMAMLQKFRHMHVHDQIVSASENLDENVEVSEWPNTHMIGSILAVIESLDPLPASIVKMAAVFSGKWELSDILASACPAWSGQARYEVLRQFLALTQLIDMDIVVNEGGANGAVGPTGAGGYGATPGGGASSAGGQQNPTLLSDYPSGDKSDKKSGGEDGGKGDQSSGSNLQVGGSSPSSAAPPEGAPVGSMGVRSFGLSSSRRMSSTGGFGLHRSEPVQSAHQQLADGQQAAFAGPFRLSNILVRKVAGSMVLEKQKRGVKRNALMDRTLRKELPPRLEVLRKKKGIPHIPWYYQVELPKNHNMRHTTTKARGSSSKELARAQSQALMHSAELLKGGDQGLGGASSEHLGEDVIKANRGEGRRPSKGTADAVGKVPILGDGLTNLQIV
ncbi:unnamed protein product [Amoebophrya sp. A25]|nr:unnamed protein product [Amoebophrya sp. A25]|eukprot:GSA25T00024269001.1